MFGFNADKYNWQARESAPKKYPMQVVSGWLRNDKESIQLKRTEIKTYNT